MPTSCTTPIVSPHRHDIAAPQRLAEDDRHPTGKIVRERLQPETQPDPERTGEQRDGADAEAYGLERGESADNGECIDDERIDRVRDAGVHVQRWIDLVLEVTSAMALRREVIACSLPSGFLLLLSASP